MKITYNKLIRDHIPEIIHADGKQAHTEVMSVPEYRQALLQKLIEEAQEATLAESEDLITELADLYEVIDTILAIWKIPNEEVLRVQKERRQRRGGFEKRIKLIWTE
jgi:predicted house-cleaning noncanonical NTP pyrophosphatase (MazG superfamily)